MLTPDLWPQARELLGWTQSDLAIRSFCTSLTVRNVERSTHRPQRNTATNVQRAFEAAGVTAEDGEVRLRMISHGPPHHGGDAVDGRSPALPEGV